MREAVELELKEGKLAVVGIRGHALTLDVSIAYLKGQHLTRAGQAFLDLLLSMIPREEDERGIKIRVSWRGCRPSGSELHHLMEHCSCYFCKFGIIYVVRHLLYLYSLSKPTSQFFHKNVI